MGNLQCSNDNWVDYWTNCYNLYVKVCYKNACVLSLINDIRNGILKIDCVAATKTKICMQCTGTDIESMGNVDVFHGTLMYASILLLTKCTDV